jgi:mono/diheme cytochrome c family protein
MTDSPNNRALTVRGPSGKPESVVGRGQQGTASPPTSARAARWRRTTAGVLALGAALAITLLTPNPAGAVDPKKIFNQRCSACHTFGKGVKVGPDLKGVTARRQRPWLLKFVRSSQRVIAGGDPVAVELYRTFKKQRMPDWTDLSPQDVAVILDWLAADGPEQKPADERDAELATATDVAGARALFDGRAPLASGGLACGACHSVREHDRRYGGTLGPDLTDAYLKYRDRALTLFLRHPCTPRQPELGAERYLAPEEAFALKAFMREVALAASPFTTYPMAESKRGQP